MLLEMWVRPRFLAFAAALVALSLVSRGADAFVGSVSTAGHQLYWSTSCETVNIYLNGFTDMTPDEVAKSIAAAAGAWGPGEVTCPTGTGDAGSGHPSFEIIPQFATGSAPAPTNDGNNTIVFQTTMAGWDALPGNPPCDVLGLTIPQREPGGQIVDVDIEINAVPGCMPYPLANLDPGVAPPMNAQVRVDLQTLMTHEFGHFLGLFHTCMGSGQQGSDDGDGPPPGSTDSYGQTIPACTQYPLGTEAVQAAAVMWYEIDYESTVKRVLTLDDARGVCTVYPPARPGPTCTQNSPDDGCGCATGGENPGSLLASAVVALALARRRRPV